MTHNHDDDPWARAAREMGGPEGALFTYKKGTWLLDKQPVTSGPDGIQAAVIMPTATIGEIQFPLSGGRPLINTWPYEQRPVTFLEVREGWDPHVEFVLVFADEAHKGTIATFSSSSWGGWYLFKGLVKPFARTRRYPVCTFGAKPREDDKNGVIDPTATICNWADPTDFPAFAAREVLRISHRPPASRAVDILDDDNSGDSNSEPPPPDDDSWDIR